MSINFFIDKATLIASWLESFLWGINTIIFAYTIFRICKNGRERMNRVTTSAIVILYILASAHMIIELPRLIAGFITFRDTIGPITYLGNVGLPLDVAKDYIYITNTVVGDSVLVWRLYTVWGKRPQISIFPIIMILGTAVSGYGAISLYLIPNSNISKTVNWGTSMFAISLSTNIIVTALTAIRIWYVGHRNRELMGRSSTPYSRIVLLVIESGLAITTAKIIEFVLFERSGNGYTGNMAITIVFDAMPQITGMMPTLIVLAVDSGYTQPDEYYSQEKHRDMRAMVFAPPSIHPSSTGFGTSECEVSVETRKKDHESL
ncbi:hypothetical protein WOLCODRAFT_143808 [Wolfiporia cocos MD-104 SS10]|uniref:Uncharacterized protein n=1 Tax=Wolfiporia cocos (strain MD-104) TaxID=742152 RepID=A0A2H3JID6_WOLCO|nr:hypothetical protein WOLCODRAFT_143808 [Wolfiporia cocos MD-104 SS10]